MSLLTTPLSRRRVGMLALGGLVLPGALGRADAAAMPADGRARAVAPHRPPRDGLRRMAPEAAGVSSAAVLAFLEDCAGAGVELHSFMLARKGAVVAEAWWWPYAPQRIHMTHSLTKSVMACGVGLALDEGRFGLDDRVVSFFPQHVPASASANLRAMTVRHLLNMTTGHARETSGSVWRPIRTSWIAEFMKIPVPFEPGSKFVYTSAASYMLSAIVTRTTGQPLADYLRPRFFDPLAIGAMHWDMGPEGINPGGNGLSWTTAASLKLGMLHAQLGRWNGRRILSERWVREATRNQVAGGHYGYQWWIKRGGAYAAEGLFTQLSVVFPEHDATLAIFSAVRDDDRVFDRIWKHFPAAFVDPARPGAAAAALRRRTAEARLLAPFAGSRSPAAGRVTGRTFRLAPNDQGAQTVRFDFSHDRVRYVLADDRGTHAIEAGLGRWLEGETSMTGARLHHEYQPEAMAVVAGARWRDPATLEMTWQFVEAAFRDTLICRFDGDRVTIDRSVNVNSNETRLPTLSGRLG